MEVSALREAGVAGLHGRSPLLRLQSDERLVALVRRGNHGAFEVLVARYESRLLAFCRHMLGSREDAEDVLQEVFAAAFNALLADDREIHVRPWLYRIARNRSLNHLRRQKPVGVDSMDVHFSENGQTTADKVHDREEFRLLMADITVLPETQRTALLLREIDDLSYDQIAEAMETTVPSVKSLLVRARVSLAEMAESRELSCADVRLELGEIAEGLKRRITPPVRRHLKTCDRCSAFKRQLKDTNKALAALLPVAPLLALKSLFFAHLGTSASAGAGAGAPGAAAGGAAAGAAATGAAAAGSAGGGFAAAGLGAIATKAAAGLAAAAVVTVGAVEVERTVTRPETRESRPAALAPARPAAPAKPAAPAPAKAAPAHARAASPAVSVAAAEPAPKPPAMPGPSAGNGQYVAAQPVAPPPPAPTQTESDTTTLPSSPDAGAQPTTPEPAEPPEATVPPATTTPAPPTSPPTGDAGQPGTGTPGPSQQGQGQGPVAPGSPAAGP
ncbi:MAG: RNA polymerase sigma factor [Solirubrobacteraceae bacterium]